MRLKFLPCLVLLGIAPVLCQAQHFYYMPNSVQMPRLKQAHDAGVSFSRGQNSGITGIELQGYYSPVNQVYVLAGFMDMGDRAVKENSKEGLKYQFYELGVGVYEALPRGTASLSLGYGHGDMYNYYQSEEFADFNIERLFIQPSILYQDDFFQGGICLRMSRIKYSSGKVAIAIPPQDLDVIERIEEKSAFFLPEIGVVGAMRVSPFVFGVNITGVFPPTDNLSFARVNTALFINLELGKLLRKKKPEKPKE